MASSTRNVKLGVCNVFYGGIDLGLTQGGVEASVTTETHKVEVDQFGKTPVNEYIQGRMASVKVPLAETTLRNLVRIMPGATLVTDGVSATGGVVFSALPTATQTVTIGGQAFTFQAGNPDTVFKVKIGATIAETAANLAAQINLAGLQPALGGLTAVVNTNSTGVTLTVTDPGAAGNAITLAATAGTASGSTLSGGVAETKARVDVGSGIGTDLLTIAKELRLHPKGLPATDFSEDFILYRAATPGAMSFAYKVDAERVFNADFTGYPDPVTGKVYSIGDPLAV